MPDEKPDESFKAQRKYSSRLKGEGLVRVTIWAPEKFRERVIKYGKKLRNEAAK